MAEGTNDARDELKQVYKEFAQPVGRSLAGFGCSFVLVALAALVVGARMSWPLGIGGGVLVIVLLILVSNRVEAPHKHRAKERVSQLEERYGLSHRESFAILASTRSGAAVRDKSEWNAFVTEVWGQSASTAAPKPPSGGTVKADGVVDMLAEIYRRPENQHPRGIRPGSAAEKEGNMSLMNSLSDIQSHTICLVPAEGGFLVYDGKSTNATHVPQLEGTKICLVEARAMVHLGNLRQRVLSETLLAGGLVDMAKLPDLADQALTALRRSGRTDGLALIRCESSGPLPLPPVHDLLVFLHSLKETQDSTRE